MRALIITAGIFFACFAVVLAYFAASGAKQEFDVKYVLTIDMRQMPEPPALPEVAPLGENKAEAAVTDGRAQSGKAPVLPPRPPIQFGQRDGAASESTR